MIGEFHRLSSYQEDDAVFSYIGTDSTEVDLIIERPGYPTALVEIKSSSRTTLADAKHLLGYLEDFPGAECYVLSQDTIARIENGINFLPWAQGMRTLGFDGSVKGF